MDKKDDDEAEDEDEEMERKLAELKAKEIADLKRCCSSHTFHILSFEYQGNALFSPEKG